MTQSTIAKRLESCFSSNFEILASWSLTGANIHLRVSIYHVGIFLSYEPNWRTTCNMTSFCQFLCLGSYSLKSSCVVLQCSWKCRKHCWIRWATLALYLRHSCSRYRAAASDSYLQIFCSILPFPVQSINLQL